MSAISEIIDRFDQAAKNWGWQEDQGTSDSEMLKSYDEYLAAKHALAESIALLPGEPVAEIVSRFGDPEAFGERELIARQDIQRFPYGTKLYTSPTPHLSVDREALKNALEMTGCENEEDLIDMANVGNSLMSTIDSVLRCEGPFKNWSPADDPAEIVGDLYNEIEENLALLEEARDALGKITESNLGKYLRTLVAGWDGDHLPEDQRFGKHPDALGSTIPSTVGDVYALDEAIQAARSFLSKLEGSSNAKS